MFEFLELDNDDHKQVLHYQEIVKEIPEQQRLTFSDLLTIEPISKVLGCISVKIISKYRIVPLFILKPGEKPILPKHLRKDFWSTTAGNKDSFLFVAMPDPFYLPLLNILKTVSGFGIVGVPVIKEDAESFIRDYLHSQPKEKRKKQSIFANLFFFIKKNYFYLLLLLIILSGLIFIKIYIGG